MKCLLALLLALLTLLPRIYAVTPVLISLSQGIAPPYHGHGPYPNMCRMGADTSSAVLSRTTLASPRIEHCLQLASYFRASDNELFHMHYWGLGIYHRLWPHASATIPSKSALKDMGNTCVFGIRFPAALVKVVMSGADVADLIELSVKRFGWEGRVGSEGNLKCWSLKPLNEVNRWVDVEFGVFRREGVSEGEAGRWLNWSA